MPVDPKPVGPRLLVKQLEASEEMQNGLILPSEVQSKERRGMVTAIGDGWAMGYDSGGEIEWRKLPVEVGQVVIWSKGAGITIKLDLEENGRWEELIVLHINEVLLTLVEREASVHSEL